MWPKYELSIYLASESAPLYLCMEYLALKLESSSLFNKKYLTHSRHRMKWERLYIYPDRRIIYLYRWSDGLSTRSYRPNTLTHQSSSTNDAPRDTPHVPITRNIFWRQPSPRLHMSRSGSRGDSHFNSCVLTNNNRLYWLWELKVFYSLVHRGYIRKVSVKLKFFTSLQ